VNLVVVELSIIYNGGPWQYGVQLLEFRGDKVAHERISWRAGRPPSGEPLALGHPCRPAGMRR
jgi:hypothetical protein